MAREQQALILCWHCLLEFLACFFFNVFRDFRLVRWAAGAWPWFLTRCYNSLIFSLMVFFRQVFSSPHLALVLYNCDYWRNLEDSVFLAWLWCIGSQKNNLMDQYFCLLHSEAEIYWGDRRTGGRKRIMSIFCKQEMLKNIATNIFFNLRVKQS